MIITIGDKIKQLRKQKGITQEQLANKEMLKWLCVNKNKLLIE